MAKLYQTFATALVPRLLAVYNGALTANILPDSMHEGLIAIIPKSGTASSDSASYRSITMINLDVKILCKILTTRLAPEVNHLVHPDQYGFAPGRNTTMNTHRLMHVLHGAEDREEDLTCSQ
ncbi:hypothetical protein NDU88_001422 [Pleurodeles waltl]|uniref:Reverse transcriptase domain-containing protein n=1 Tax=Pleurodeles waltl TaxID=8319 RepID=A0AAV7MKW1_PLEWA|nr:hypothetical protein NDU88_001422 [Pleurodeles waltl]